ncbi:MAG TPA: inositol monophosphatase family protein [Solirubrobacteraceae bacterium]
MTGADAPTEAPPPSQLREIAASVAKLAGGLLLQRFEQGHSEGVRSKSTPTDLVSEADLAAEQAIRQRLSELRPDDAFLGEEGGGRAGASGLRWVVDPLDGTVNFLFGIPQWSVSIAVQEIAAEGGPAGTADVPTGAAGRPTDAAGTTPTTGTMLAEGRLLACAIFDPCRDELWEATLDGPATLNGASISGSRHEELATAMLATGLAYDAEVRAKQAQVLMRLIPQVRDIRRLGSAALDLAWTAAGRYDAYFERTVKLWDIAAGVLICERAGVALRELPEEELPWGVLAASPALADQLRERILGLR